MRARHKGERVCMSVCVYVCLYASVCMYCMSLYACAICVEHSVQVVKKKKKEEKSEKPTERKREKSQSGHLYPFACELA